METGLEPGRIQCVDPLDGSQPKPAGVLKQVRLDRQHPGKPEVGCQEGLRFELAGWIADQEPADRHRRHAAAIPQCGARCDLDDAIGSAVPVIFLGYALFEPDYARRFFETAGGIIALSIAGGLELIGAMWLYYLLRNDY